MFDMAGASSTSNFAQAGKAAARENERILQATLENSPNMGKIVQEAAVRRGKENIASLRAETKVQVAGLNEYAATKNAKELGDAEMDYKKSKRKAGVLAAAGGLLGTGIGGLGKSDRKKRVVGEDNAYFDERIKKLRSDADGIRNQAPPETEQTDWTNYKWEPPGGETDKSTAATGVAPITPAAPPASDSSGATPSFATPKPTNGNPDRAAAFNQIYDIAKKVGGTKFPEVVAAQSMHETGWLSAPNSVYKSTGGTNPFGQTGDRGYGTIPRKGFEDGWTLYPDKETAVKDHIKLWHDTGNHSGNYNAFDSVRDGVASVAPAYSPDADPENIRRGYTVDGYSKGVKSALTEMGYGW